jgi:hypothetical protein
MVNEQEQGSKSNPQENRFLSSLEKPIAAVSSPVKKLANTVTKGIGAAVSLPKDWAAREEAHGEENWEEMLLTSPTKVIAGVPDQIRNGSKKARDVVGAELGKIPVPSLKKKEKKTAVPKVQAGGDGLPALPSDKMLESMDVIMTKMLTNVSVNDFYEIFWSEGNGTDKAPFYGPWLSQCGKTDIIVNDWTVAKDEGFVGEWDKEVYTHTREVTFRFERTSRLAPGIVDVKHTQHLRVEGNDRCVVSTMVKVDGVPFSDSFQVQNRWVATRVGERDLSIKVGMFVFFVKQVLVAGQIRAGTTKETTDAQLDLFIRMKKVCGSEEVVVLEETRGGPIDVFAKHSTDLLSFCFPFFRYQAKYRDDIDKTIHEVEEKMATVRTLPNRAGLAENEENRKYILSEFSNVQDALNSILIRNMGLESSVTPKQEDTVADDGVSRLVNAFAAPFERFYEEHLRNSSFPVGQGSALRRLSPHRYKQPTEQEEELFEQPSPDETLTAMNVIITKVLDDTSVTDFFNVCLSEGQGTNNEVFYGPWLTRSGKTDIQVGDWTIAEDEGFVGEWDKEHYSRKRELSFKFERSSFIAQGPSIASVKQTQYCRVEGNNKCVFATTIETVGVPFSDSFNIQIRWVVTRVDKDKIAIKVGLFVLFLKQILISGKIRAGVTQESLKQQLDLFRSVKSALGSPTVQESIQEQYGLGEDAEEGGPFSVVTWVQKMTNLYPDSMIEKDEELGKQFKTMERKMRAIRAFLDERDPSESTEDMNFFLAELVVVREALDNLILWHGDQEQGSHTISEASFVPTS